MKIYTRTGDDGTTSLFSGDRVKKNSSAIEAYGTVDELNCFVGWARAACESSKISGYLDQIQHELHKLCSDFATPLASSKKVDRMVRESSDVLERQMDEMERGLNPLKNFILPGGSELSARLHICRTVCRRAERSALSYAEKETINSEACVYLNRLSDFFFMVARFANQEAGCPDVLWDKSR